VIGATLTDDTAIDNGQDGFDVGDADDGTIIDGAKVQNNVEGGIEVRTETGNQFGTTSATCIPD
jgi:hypothetical protein